ncbi:MAG: hypothetical protein IK081_00435 [Lachnospiraceae bacterium]|nr:hypothetical protein [Lachnospiraceae bacterium]
MKKWLGRFLVGVTVAAMIIASTGCGQDAGAAKRTGSNTKSVKDILDAQKSSESDAAQDAKTEEGSGEATAESNSAKDASTEGSAETGSSVGDGETSVSSGEGQASVSSGEGASEEIVPDVDLTTLSSTLVYSEVYNMMTAPSDYVGKNVKMKGAFSYYQDPNTGNEYYACIIQDATACCAQGIEFVLAGDHKYPDDYPEMNSEITVAGVFDTYMEGEYMYCTLKNARFVQ